MKLLERIKRLNTQLHCEHDWRLIEPAGEYYDEKGFHIIQWNCQCRNCGKEQVRKFY